MKGYKDEHDVYQTYSLKNNNKEFGKETLQPEIFFKSLRTNSTIISTYPYFSMNETHVITKLNEIQTVEEKIKFLLDMIFKNPTEESFDFLSGILDYDLVFFSIMFFDFGINHMLIDVFQKDNSFYPLIALLFSQLIQFDSSSYVQEIMDFMLDKILENDFFMIKKYPFESLTFLYSSIKHVHIISFTLFTQIPKILNLSFSFEKSLQELSGWILYYLLQNFPIHFDIYCNSHILEIIINLLKFNSSPTLQMIMLKVILRIIDIKFEVIPLHELLNILFECLSTQSSQLQELSLICISHILNFPKSKISINFLDMIIQKGILNHLFFIIQNESYVSKKQSILCYFQIISLQGNYEDVLSSEIFNFILMNDLIFDPEIIKPFLEMLYFISSKLSNEGKTNIIHNFFYQNNIKNLMDSISNEYEKDLYISSLMKSLSFLIL